MKIGIIDIQGDVREHLDAFKSLDDSLDLIRIKNAGILPYCDGIVIPGGESTTIGKGLKKKGMFDEIKDFGMNGKPILGTCAGLILLSKGVYGEERDDLIELLDVYVERNSYGRQRESFEIEVRFQNRLFNAVFIRAPVIKRVGNNVKVLAEYNNSPIAVLEGNIMGFCFHPELSRDLIFQDLFLELVRSNLRKLKTNKI
ncbi:MAG: pyridoxal 5'-phosphate synthase glutaminase subunit PdxT [Candidatus Methanoliparum thermophilum]|uniref:Pyridoxal 5'-phosphate synthase subunit PdxT n=1 Tax=Methanoliparum thermophilum TaxID=2491083 RepID=A0A520KQK2_METT2|nr:MAG: pyridoxal 5'-phosphate synthase glutaminase subunit PdxT [Candidatus Methanoliparum thermophilum]